MMEVTRSEYEARHLKIESDLLRVDTQINNRLDKFENRLDEIEEHLNKQDVEIAKQSSQFWKFGFSTTIGALIGLVPYFLHIAGAIH